MKRGALATVVLAGFLFGAVSAAAQSSASGQAADLSRIKRRLATPTPLRDAALDGPIPTFRVSVTQKSFDIWSFWGEPEAVWKEVRPRGGAWADAFQDMVTPEEFKGLGPGMGNAERAQLAATSMVFALAMKYLPGAIKGAFQGNTERKAKAEVQEALEEFYQLHPEARPAPAAPTPP